MWTTKPSVNVIIVDQFKYVNVEIGKQQKMKSESKQLSKRNRNEIGKMENRCSRERERERERHTFFFRRLRASQCDDLLLQEGETERVGEREKERVGEREKKRES